MMFWGKLAGFVIGAFSGLGIYGVIVGVVLGHLVDMYLKQRKMKCTAADFFSDPAGTDLLPDKEFLMVCGSGFCVFVSGFDPDRVDYARELLGGILQAHLSLTGKEIESVKDYITACLNTPEPDIDGMVRVYTASNHTHPADIALISALFRVEERTGITQEKTRFIRNLARQVDISDEEFYSLRRHFLGVTLENYEILGLPLNAPTEEVKRTYRNLVAFFHPDGGAELSEEQKKESGEAFLTIQKAYKEIMKERGEQ